MSRAKSDSEAGRVLVHAVGADRPDIKVPGFARAYPYRACLGLGRFVLLPGHPTAAQRQWIADLKDAGVGPDEHVWVEAGERGNLYQAVAQDPRLRLLLLQRIEEGGVLNFYRSSDPAVRFVKDTLGVPWKSTDNPEPHLAFLLGNKLHLRRIAAREGLSRLFPEYKHLRTTTDLELQFPRGFTGDVAMTWAFDQASTEGHGFYKGGPTPAEIARRWDPRGMGAIMQRFVPHIPASLTFRLSRSGVKFLFASLQYLVGLPVGQVLELGDLLHDPAKPRLGAHRGNILSTEGGVGPISEERVQAAVRFVMPLVGKIHTMGYRGPVGLDIGFGIERDYVFEVNDHFTHARYARDVLKGIRGFFPDSRLTLALVDVNTISPRVRSYDEAKARLQAAGLWFRGREGGALIYHEPLIEAGKCGVAVAATTYGEVVEMVEASSRVLAGE